MAEAHSYAPHARFIGIDVDDSAVDMATKNLPYLGAGVRVIRGDASNMALPNGSASLFLANLPFGKQFGDRKDNPVLYRGILTEFRRIGSAKGWRAVLLTSDVGSIHEGLRMHPALVADEVFKVTVLGEPAHAFLVRPR